MFLFSDEILSNFNFQQYLERSKETEHSRNAKQKQLTARQVKNIQGNFSWIIPDFIGITQFYWKLFKV